MMRKSSSREVALFFPSFPFQVMQHRRRQLSHLSSLLKSNSGIEDRLGTQLESGFHRSPSSNLGALVLAESYRQAQERTESPLMISPSSARSAAGRNDSPAPVRHLARKADPRIAHGAA